MLLICPPRVSVVPPRLHIVCCPHSRNFASWRCCYTVPAVAPSQILSPFVLHSFCHSTLSQLRPCRYFRHSFCHSACPSCTLSDSFAFPSAAPATALHSLQLLLSASVLLLLPVGSHLPVTPTLSSFFQKLDFRSTRPHIHARHTAGSRRRLAAAWLFASAGEQLPTAGAARECDHGV